MAANPQPCPAPVKLRLLDIGPTDPLRSQAVYHGIAEHMDSEDTPVLILTRPTAAYVSIGLHQDATAELDLDFCRRHGLAVIRRQVGGGTVLLDGNQLFFHFVFPRQRAPRRVEALYARFIEPVLRCYTELGLPARRAGLNDIAVGERRIGGTGAASIGNATVMVGSFLFDFDHALMARLIRAPSAEFRAWFARLLPEHITTLRQHRLPASSMACLQQVFLRQVSTCLDCEIQPDRITPGEEDAITEAARELADPEWLALPGKKAVRHGIKLRAGAYLTETRAELAGRPLRRLLFQQQGRIAALAFPQAPPSLQRLAPLLQGLPLREDALLAALEGHLEQDAARALCRLVLDGAQFEPV